MTGEQLRRLDTLLVTTDGSEPAETAARLGFEFAGQCEASVHVLSIADSSVATGTGYAGDSTSVRERLRERASERATVLRDEASERGLDATATVREGIPASEIGTYASDIEADAIYLGTAGRSGTARAIVGSVADKVIRTAPTPVITVTPQVDKSEPTDSILLPVDGGETSLAPLEWTLGLAKQLDATVHLLSAIGSERSRRLSSLMGANTGSGLREQLDGHLERIAASANEHDVATVRAVREGDPATEIVEYTRSNDIDMITMGTAGRGGFERAILGSVTDEVVRTAPVPVLTARPTEPFDES